jgi:methionyl-tRNA synthetase
MNTRRYVTTPLYYVNARPHLGHAYTTIMADVVKRHYAQRGEKVVMLTGTDEHGEKIAQIAARENKEPKQLADEVSADFRETWQKMGLDFDIFYRTTDVTHVAAVKTALQIMKDKGEIEFREYEGNYCVGCERFLTETEITADGLCPDHQKKPEHRKEGNYFFLMSRYQQKLIDHLEKNPGCIRPEQYRGEILSFLKNEKLGDLCISRPKSRLTWGIELPFDSNFVTYVWVDALLNYLVATGWPDPSKFDQALWAEATHFIGKDIVKTHSVYWFSILMALGVKPPKALHVNGYWLVGGTKMSKSLGNVVRPLDVEATYGRETLRFYLIREMSYGNDSTFTLESYVNSINAHLANGIGNLCSRVLTLCQKNGVTQVPDGVRLETADQALLDKRAHALSEWNAAFEDLKFQNALKSWSELVTACDLYINDQKPWALAKDPALAHRLHTVLAVCMQVIEALGVIVYPVLPEASLKICHALGLEKPELSAVTRPEVRKFPAIAEVPKLFMRVALPAVEPEPKKG